MRRCGVAPPPIIFKRLTLLQQIIYRRKGNLSESPNHLKYWENILISVRGGSPTNNFQKTYVTPTNYISSEREFIGESESFKILGKYFDFALL